MNTLSARAILDRLVGFPTVSRDSNLDLIGWVEDYLSGFGVSSRRVYDPTGRKAALYANVGPEVEGGVVLSGHTDVVPVDGQDWSTDPFSVVEKGGKLYGRGTCDMKGFDALALAMVPYALERGVARPLQIALSYDEEVGCVGAPPMIDDMVAHLPRAASAVIGEPTMLRPVTGHNASVMFRIHVKGYEVHSSKLPEGVSAVHEAGRILQWINEINDRIQGAEPDPVSALFDPPFTTAHVGMIHGGTAHNITAKDCHLNVGFRCPAGDDPEAYATEFCAFLDALGGRLNSRHPKAGLDYDRSSAVPGLKPESEGRAESLIRQLTGDNGTHVVTYGTEAGQFQDRGYSAVVCGPGDIAQAHQPDEWIEVDQFEKGEALLRRVVDTLV